MKVKEVLSTLQKETNLQFAIPTSLMKLDLNSVKELKIKDLEEYEVERMDVNKNTIKFFLKG